MTLNKSTETSRDARVGACVAGSILLAALLAVVALSLVENPWTNGSVSNQATAQGAGEGTTKSFSLVYNINNAGYIDVCGCKQKEVRQGSITRRAAYLTQLRTTGRQILLLDGGSAFFPINKPLKPTETDAAISKAELIVEAYNRMSYRAMAVGPYDLLAGIENLKKLEKKAKFKFLSANFVDKEGNLHFEPSTIFKVGGAKVGVFGLTLDTIPGPRLEKWAPGSKIADPLAAAEKEYAKLKPQVDIVIALAHLREDSNFALIKKLAGLQVLIDPYIQFGTHKTWLKEEEEWLAQRDKTLFLRSDGQGARLGVVDIEIKKAGEPLADGFLVDDLKDAVEYDEATEEDKKELASLEGENLFRFTRVSLEPHHSTDPQVDALVEAWKKKLSLANVPTLGTLPNKDKFSTHDTCKSCHEKQYAFWKTTSHSHALETLKKTNDHQRYDCVGCHTLGYGQAWLDTSKIGNYADVQCESCHGNQPGHNADPKKHSYKRITKDSCLACHNKEHTKTDFPYIRAKRKVACPKG